MVKSMEYICRTSIFVYNFLVCVVILVSFVNDVPENQHRHQYSWTSLDEEIVLKSVNEYIILDSEWVNPCGTPDPTSTYNETGLPARDPKVLKPLRQSLPFYIVRLKGPHMHTIDTSDISEWFKFHNSTYSFLAQINPTTDHINLPRRHIQTQKYVGAFQYLANKQKEFDSLRNDGNEVTNEVLHLLILAKALLCDIETVIKNTIHPIPHALSPEQMDKFLTFRSKGNNNKLSVDELDNKFAKVRFHEYVHNFQLLLNRPGHRHHFKSHSSFNENDTKT